MKNENMGSFPRGSRNSGTDYALSSFLALAVITLSSCGGRGAPPTEVADTRDPVVAPAEVEQGAAAQYRGYVAVSEDLRKRVLAPGTAFELGIYLEEAYQDGSAQIVDLLGSYKGSGTKSTFRNGTPNGMSSLIWYVMFSQFAGDIAKHCAVPAASEATLKLNEEFGKVLAPLCLWPKPEAKSDEVLLSYWISLAGFEAPFSQYEAWRAMVLLPENDQLGVRDMVAGMTVMILMNPYVLLR